MKNQITIPETFFINNGKNTKPTVNAQFFNNTIWLTTKQIAELFETAPQNVDYHRNNIYKDGELAENTTTKNFLDVVNRGFRGKVEENITYYNLDMVIAVGYRLNSQKAIEFRNWATPILREYIQKGFALDDARFKQCYQFDKAYFRELRERIKDIRISERMLYQQLKDIYALSADYNNNQQETWLFFAKVQNKVHFAITGNTSAEIIYNRADSTKENMNLTSWNNAPDGKITKQDIVWAKNYLQESELKELKYIINMFLDFAERRAEIEDPIFMNEWEKELDRFLEFNKKAILTSAGKTSRIAALKKASEEYSKYKLRIKQDEKVKAEQEHTEDIKELEKMLKDAE